MIKVFLLLRFSGIVNYLKQMSYLRIYAHFVYAYAKVDVMKITKHIEDSSVKVRWRITGITGYSILFKMIQFRVWRPTQMIEQHQRVWVFFCCGVNFCDMVTKRRMVLKTLYHFRTSLAFWPFIWGNSLKSTLGDTLRYIWISYHFSGVFSFFFMLLFFFNFYSYFLIKHFWSIFFWHIIFNSSLKPI